jgi:hypothetical protein
MMTKEAIVFGGQEGLDEPLGELFVAHRDPSLLADRGNQLPVAGIDPQGDLQLHVPQAVNVGQRGLQIDISTDISERN